MKQQQPGSQTKKILKIFKSYGWAICLPVAFIFIVSCKNDLVTIQDFVEEEEMPSLSGKNILWLRSDSARLTIRVKAPLIKRFDDVDEPYIEFPQGIEVYFLDSLQNVKSSIIAKYAIRYEKDYLYYARDSVVASNLKTGEWIKSEEMYWDEKKGTVYSDRFSTIKRLDGIFYGPNGFEALQDFSSWKMKKLSGSLNISDEENE